MFLASGVYQGILESADIAFTAPSLAEIYGVATNPARDAGPPVGTCTARAVSGTAQRSGRGAFEMSWDGDGRGVFTYGTEVKPGETHVIWLRVGTHSVLP